jgi:hypothetical protein
MKYNTGTISFAKHFISVHWLSKQENYIKLVTIGNTSKRRQLGSTEIAHLKLASPHALISSGFRFVCVESDTNTHLLH